MLTVPEAAKRVGRNPETIRRWIRAGRLRSQKIGTQHFVDEADLAAAAEQQDRELPVPDYLAMTPDGAPIPNVVRWVRLAREGR